MSPSDAVACATVDAKDIEKTAQTRFEGRFVSIGEVFAFEALGLKARIVETNSLPIEERVGIKYHCFRGIVDVAETTVFYIQTAPRDEEILKVLNARAPPNEEDMFVKNFVMMILIVKVIIQNNQHILIEIQYVIFVLEYRKIQL